MTPALPVVAVVGGLIVGFGVLLALLGAAADAGGNKRWSDRLLLTGVPFVLAGVPMVAFGMLGWGLLVLLAPFAAFALIARRART